MALYSVRSERQFCEQLDYDLLFRWFLDMDMTEASFDATAFTDKGYDTRDFVAARERGDGAPGGLRRANIEQPPDLAGHPAPGLLQQPA